MRVQPQGAQRRLGSTVLMVQALRGCRADGCSLGRGCRGDISAGLERSQSVAVFIPCSASLGGFCLLAISTSTLRTKQELLELLTCGSVLWSCWTRSIPCCAWFTSSPGAAARVEAAVEGHAVSGDPAIEWGADRNYSPSLCISRLPQSGGGPEGMWGAEDNS